MRSGFGQSVLVWLLVAGSFAMLAGCKTVEAEPKIEYRTANVAVAAPCVVNRPEKPAALKDYVLPETWAALAPGAKAQALKAQAGERLNYEGSLEAATSGCPDVSSPPAASSAAPGHQ